MPPTGRRPSFSRTPSTWVVHSRWPTRTRWITRRRVPGRYRGLGGVGVIGLIRRSRRLWRLNGADILLAVPSDRQGATPAVGRDRPAGPGRGRGGGRSMAERLAAGTGAIERVGLLGEETAAEDQ